MTRPWVAVEAAIRVNHKLVALPSDSARWGWVCILGEAKQQRPAGAFHSLAHLREAAGRFARFIPDYQRANLLETSPDLCDRCTKKWPKADAGTLVVHDWHVHQVDPGAAKRAKDWRDGADRTGTERETNENPSFVDTDPSRALSLSLSMSRSTPGEDEPYQVPRPADDAWRVAQAVEDLVGRWSYSKGSPVYDRMAMDVAAFGPDRVISAYRELRAERADSPMDAAQIVFGAHKRLFPIPDAPAMGRAPKPKGLQPDMTEVDGVFDHR